MAALTFPLSLAQFLDLLPIERARVWLDEPVGYERNRLGEVLPFSLGDRLWTGEIELGRMIDEDLPGLIASRIDLLRQPGGRWLWSDPARPAPRLDPTGATLGAATVTVASLPTDPREIGLAGLPAGYVLSAGDWVGWSYSGRRALHQVVNTTATADGAGAVTVELIPPVRAGVTIGTVVDLKTARCRAVFLPDSVDRGATRRALVEGETFRWIQSLR